MWVGGEDSESIRALHAAADQGLNFIDTALAYGNGHSERLVGRFVRERKECLYVATKIPPKNKIWPARGRLEEAFPHDYVVRCTEMSLQNLKAEVIDLLQLHVWDPSWIDDEQCFDALKSLQEQGKISRVGISVNDHQPETALELVRSGKVDTIQVMYNIFEQAPERSLLPLCREQDVGVIVRVPFDEGSLTGAVTPKTSFPRKDWRNLYFKGDRKQRVFERVQELRELLDGEVKNLPELALKFCLHHPAVSTVIPGMRSAGHVKDNLSVADKEPLSEGLIAQLRQHAWDKNFYPTV